MQCLIHQLLEGVGNDLVVLHDPPGYAHPKDSRYSVTVKDSMVRLICSCNAVCTLGFKQATTAAWLGLRLKTEPYVDVVSCIQQATWLRLSKTYSVFMISTDLLVGPGASVPLGIAAGDSLTIFFGHNSDRNPLQ